MTSINNFYQFVNNDWLNNNSIPENQIQWSEFDILQKKNNIKLKKIIESKNNDNILKKLFYSYQSKDKICSLDNINDILLKINNINTLNEYYKLLAELHIYGCDNLWNIHINDNINDTTNNITYLEQGILNLPDNKYYYDNKYINQKNDYQDLIKRIFKIVYPQYEDNILNDISMIILKFETELAKIMLDTEELRDINILNNLSYDNIINILSNVNFNTYINEIINLTGNNIKIDKFNNLIVEFNKDKNYFIKLNDILKCKCNKNNCECILIILKLYLQWQFFINYLPLISEEYYDIFFNFFNNKLRGQIKKKSIEDRSISTVINIFDDIISNDFGEKYYSIEINNYINEMIINISTVLKTRIKNLSWMTNETKEKALLKLNNIKYKIGYNKIIKDYSSLIINDNLFYNIIEINKYNAILNFNKLNKKVDVDEWVMPGYYVNACYVPTKNQIIIPTGILQDSFFNIENKNEVNYAKIGSIIGHEIIHAFDDRGRLFDEKGNLNFWWTDEDNTHYEKIVEKIIKLYNNENINGKLTVGENIADIGGVKLALEALKIKNNSHNDNFLFKYDIQNYIREILQKKNNYKLFFISYAELWRCKMTQEIKKEKLLVDPHSPPDIRVNTTLKNITEFYESFNIEQNLIIPELERINMW